MPGDWHWHVGRMVLRLLLVMMMELHRRWGTRHEVARRTAHVMLIKRREGRRPLHELRIRQRLPRHELTIRGRSAHHVRRLRRGLRRHTGSH